MLNKDTVISILKFIRPKFYNRITWTLIVGGLALLTTSFIENIISAILTKKFNLPLTIEQANIYGIIIILFALLYNFSINYLNYLEKKETINRLDQTDLKLFKQIRKILPSDGSIDFITENSFASAFRWSELKQIKNFIYKSERPEFKFLNPELEKLKSTLSKNSKEFISLLASKSYYINNTIEIASIPKEWEMDEPEKHQALMSNLNELQDKIIESYEKLIHEGRKKLGD